MNFCNLQFLLNEKIKLKLNKLFSEELNNFQETNDFDIDLLDININSNILPINFKIDFIQNDYIFMKCNENTQEEKLIALCKAFLFKKKYYPCIFNTKFYALNKFSNYGKSKYEFYKILCKEHNLKISNLCLVYDLETTGLIDKNNNYPRITEIYMKDITTGMVCFDNLVKIGNFEYDEEFIKNLNGITRNECNEKGMEYKKVNKELKNLINMCNENSCIFVAHNGFNFDHKILFKNINGGKIKTMDSLHFIPLIMNFVPKNKKLSNLYEEIIGKKYDGKIHTSKCDVYMLIKIMKKLKIDYNKLYEIISK